MEQLDNICKTVDVVFTMKFGTVTYCIEEEDQKWKIKVSRNNNDEVVKEISSPSKGINEVIDFCRKENVIVNELVVYTYGIEFTIKHTRIDSPKLITWIIQTIELSGEM